MSYSISGRPDHFSSAFNPIYFYASSTDKNEEGFKYVLDIYSANTSSKLGTYKLFPRPVDGLGVADINQLLSSQVSFHINPNNNTFEPSPESFIDYSIQFGEEYVKYWSFVDNSSVTGPFAGYTKLYSNSTSHHFQVGDSVFVNQTAGYSYSGYNGVHTVLALNGTSGITIDVAHVSTPTDGGTVVYADHHKTIYTGLTSETGYTAFNGVINHQALITYTSSTYNMLTGNNARFLSNIPQDYRVKPTNKMWLNLYASASVNNTKFAYITTRYGTYSLQNTASTQTTIQSLAIGPDNITTANTLWVTDTFGTLPVFKDECWDWTGFTNNGGWVQFNGATQSPWYNNTSDQVIDYISNGEVLSTTLLGITGGTNSVTAAISFTSFTQTSGTLYQDTDYYTVEILGTGGTSSSPSSTAYTFNVDKTETKYGNIELYFIDRLGSLIPVNFELLSTKSIAIDRNEYQSLLGNLRGGRWQFDSYERGRGILSTTVKQNIELNSNWLTESEANYLQELYGSPEVYIKEYGQLWPVIMKENSYTIKTKNNIKNIQIKITVEYANNNNSQRF